MNITILGVSGAVGSFSEEAAFEYVKRVGIKATMRYLIDMEGVLAAIDAGEVDIGIFPVVNLYGGLVMQAFKAMGRYLFTPIDEQWLLVNQCLLALPGTSKNEINQIISHSQGLAQCENYLKQNFRDLEYIEYIDTAKAAHDLAEGRLPLKSAVIAPKQAAHIYNLKIIDENIQDSNRNLTAFIIAKKNKVK